MNKQISFSLLVVAISITFIQSCELERIDPPCPIIDSLSPGAARVDDVISVKGKNFVAGKPGLYTVTIGGTTVPATEVPDANTLKFKIPLGKGGQVKVNLAIAPNCSSNAVNFVYRYTPLRSEKLAGIPMSTSCVNVTDNCFNSPVGIDLDNQGNLIVADKNNFVIRKINTSTGTIDATYGKFKPSTITCDPATVPNSNNAILNYPYDVEVDASGDIYFVEEFNKTIRLLRPGTVTPVYLIAGSCSGSMPGACGSGAVTAPYSLSKDGNKICYVDNGNIKMMDLASSTICGNVNTILSHGTTQYFRGVEISNTRAGQGPVFIADELEKNIKAASLSGSNMTVLPANPTGPFNLNQPIALTLDSKGNIFIADKGSDRIYVLYTNGDLDILAGTSEGNSDNTDALSAMFKNPSGLALNEAAGILYVADAGNNVIRKVTFK